jgi:hypothetical protein
LGSLSLSLCTSFLLFAGCFVWWSLPGFHHFCGFKSLVTYFLFLAKNFEFTLEKLKFSYFFQNFITTMRKFTPKKKKEKKKNNFVHAAPNNLHLCTKFHQSIGVI